MTVKLKIDLGPYFKWYFGMTNPFISLTTTRFKLWNLAVILVFLTSETLKAQLFAASRSRITFQARQPQLSRNGPWAFMHYHKLHLNNNWHGTEINLNSALIKSTYDRSLPLLLSNSRFLPKLPPPRWPTCPRPPLPPKPRIPRPPLSLSPPSFSGESSPCEPSFLRLKPPNPPPPRRSLGALLSRSRLSLGPFAKCVFLSFSLRTSPLPRPPRLFSVRSEVKKRSI